MYMISVMIDIRPNRFFFCRFAIRRRLRNGKRTG